MRKFVSNSVALFIGSVISAPFSVSHAAVISIINNSFENTVTPAIPGGFFSPVAPTDWTVTTPASSNVQVGVVQVTPFQSAGNYMHVTGGAVSGMGAVGVDDNLFSMQINSITDPTPVSVAQALGVNFNTADSYAVSIDLGRRQNGFNGVSAFGELTLSLQSNGTVLASSTLTNYAAGHTAGTFTSYDIPLTNVPSASNTGNVDLVISYVAENQQPGSDTPRFSGALDFNVVELTVVPEPSSLFLMALGVCFVMRKRRP